MNAALRHARYALDILGLATLFSLVAFYVSVWNYERQAGRRYAGAPPSEVAVEFARRVTPDVETYAANHEESIVALAGSWPLRAAARLGFPAFLRGIRSIVTAAVDFLMDIFGEMSIKDLAAKILLHNRSRHRAVDPSIVAAARGAVP